MALAPDGWSIERRLWGTLPNGATPVELITLQSPTLRVSICPYGGIVQSVQWRPNDKASTSWIDLILGYESLAQYIDDDAYMGFTVGRYGNRIRNAEAQIVAPADTTADGKLPRLQPPVTMSLKANDGVHCLHGGPRGFSRLLWNVECCSTFSKKDQIPGLFAVLRLHSPDGDEGFTGDLDVKVTYGIICGDAIGAPLFTTALPHSPALFMDFWAAARRGSSVCNIINHNYWNLSGYTTAARSSSASIRQHVLQIGARFFTVNDEALIPTGEVKRVSSTEFDFAAPRTIWPAVPPARGASPAGFDHNFVISGVSGQLRFAASLWDPTSHIQMVMFSSYPGLQLYTSNFLTSRVGHKGVRFGQYAGVCLEAQLFPDAPHHPQFPSSTIVAGGPPFHHRCVYQFGLSDSMAAAAVNCSSGSTSKL